jgi:hypothetical protein
MTNKTNNSNKGEKTMQTSEEFKKELIDRVQCGLMSSEEAFEQYEDFVTREGIEQLFTPKKTTYKLLASRPKTQNIIEAITKNKSHRIQLKHGVYIVEVFEYSI